METLVERKESSNGQLISVNRKDTSRLLEVYVKRSLSLNDSGETLKNHKNKWVMMPDRPRRMRRHSSDPSLLLSPSADDYPSLAPPPPPSETPVDLPEEVEWEEEKEVKPEVSVPKKRKKPSLWKSFLGLFSKKWGEDDQEEETQRGATDVFLSRKKELSQVSATCLPLSGTGQKKPRRLRSSRRHRSFRKSFKKSFRKDITVAETGVRVEPTDAYFEKVSQEMELIVHQVKEKENEKVLTDEEVINRIIALTKEQGDAIDEKLKENPTLSNFFQGMSYSAFQKLADTYLEEEATPVQSEAPSLANPPAAAPELVKLAFTLDFTARVAGLSRQNVGHITGLGNRYLEDRFEYKQACTDHPWSDSDD